MFDAVGVLWEQYGEDIRKSERERIIRLLELNVAYSVAVCDGGNKNILEIEELIALIKGENK